MVDLSDIHWFKLDQLKALYLRGIQNRQKSLEMELNQPAEDIDRTSINGKAAAIFLNRICVKDIGKCDVINNYVICPLRNDSKQ